MKTWGFMFAAATAAMIASAFAQPVTDDHLGTVHFPISCTTVQGKFDRAVALLHNFFYPETVKAFQAIVKEDPSCAMGYWGLAMSELPNPLVPALPARQPQSRSGSDPAGQSREDPDTARGGIPCRDRDLLQGLRDGRPQDPRAAL